MSAENMAAADEVDCLLVTRFLSGDQNAFNTLFHRHQDYVYHIVLGIIGKPEEARDAAQEVFIQVYRSLASFRKGSRFSTWLYRIAVNRALDCARASQRRRWFSLEDSHNTLPSREENTDEALEKDIEKKGIHELLQSVPVQHRDVLVLHYFQELSMEEIAETLGCSVSAVKVRLHRARKCFKERYSAIYEDNE